MTNQTWKEAFANLFQDLLNLIRFYYRDLKITNSDFNKFHSFYMYWFQREDFQEIEQLKPLNQKALNI